MFSNLFHPLSWLHEKCYFQVDLSLPDSIANSGSSFISPTSIIKHSSSLSPYWNIQTKSLSSYQNLARASFHNQIKVTSHTAYMALFYIWSQYNMRSSYNTLSFLTWLHSQGLTCFSSNTPGMFLLQEEHVPSYMLLSLPKTPFHHIAIVNSSASLDIY